MMSAVSVMPFTGVNASYLRIFRVLRCMRPLRLLRRFQGLRVVVHALLESVPHVIDLVVISSLFMLMFGILGVELFGGKLYHCTDPLVTHHAGCVGNFSSPITHDVTERQWVNKYPQHYDNVFSSTLTVFEVTTRAMWKDIMYHTIEGISNDEAPRYDDQAARRYGCIYFIFVTIICGVFTTSLFAGLVIVDFAVVKMETQVRLCTPQPSTAPPHLRRLHNPPQPSTILHNPPQSSTILHNPPHLYTPTRFHISTVLHKPSEKSIPSITYQGSIGKGKDQSFSFYYNCLQCRGTTNGQQSGRDFGKIPKQMGLGLGLVLD